MDDETDSNRVVPASAEREASPEQAALPNQDAPSLVPIDSLSQDRVFQMRPVGDLSLLAVDLARLGQLFPVELRRNEAGDLQIICGFRRIAALAFLQRKEVLARIHRGLSDEDALLMALAAAIHHAPISREQLENARNRLEQEGRLFASARDMVEKALGAGEALQPEGTEEEVDADELAASATERLGEINQDLSLLADVFLSLDIEQREQLLRQLRYSAELVEYLEGLHGA
jgi:ParB-like chromosome segregation protein Spo0J